MAAPCRICSACKSEHAARERNARRRPHLALGDQAMAHNGLPGHETATTMVVFLIRERGALPATPPRPTPSPREMSTAWSLARSSLPVPRAACVGHALQLSFDLSHSLPKPSFKLAPAYAAAHGPLFLAHGTGGVPLFLRFRANSIVHELGGEPSR